MKEPYIVFFKKISELDNGSKAALKRSVGTMLGKADGKALTAFYRCLPYGVPTRQEDRWFALACISCLWKEYSEEGKPFEKLVAEMISNGNTSDSTTHRIEILLDTDWDDDGYMLTKLSRIVVLLRQKSDRSLIDLPALLEDLIYWNSDTQYVQRKWAREIFADKKLN